MKLKKSFVIIILAIVLASFQNLAQTRTDSDGNTIDHPYFVVAQYQMGDFSVAKESGSYGLGVIINSITHWGRFHVGANVNFSINAGFIKNWGCIIDFGPSARIDINERFFVNIPVNAMCNVIFPVGSSETEAIWGVKISPSIHTFLSDRFGLFVGPQLNFGFNDSSAVSCGFQAGISYAF